MDYSHINDFRGKPELCKNIVEHDLKHVGMADVLVVIAHSPQLWDWDGDGDCKK